MEGQALYELFKQLDQDQFEFEVVRDVIEENRSFSADAMEGLRNGMITFVGARVMSAWEKRNVPPTRLTVHMEVTVQ